MTITEIKKALKKILTEKGENAYSFGLYSEVSNRTCYKVFTVDETDMTLGTLLKIMHELEIDFSDIHEEITIK